MNSWGRSWAGVALGVATFFSQVSFGFHPADVDWTGERDEIKIEGRNFSGSLTNYQTWDGMLCQGSLQFSARGKGTVEKIEFEPKEEGELAVYANLTDVNGDLRGRYVSELSLCIPVGISQPFRMDRAEAWADVTFKDLGPSETGEAQPPAVTVRIQKTKVHRLKMMELAPPFLEDQLTDFANQLLESVWASSLGRWVEERVAKEFFKIFPPS